MFESTDPLADALERDSRFHRDAYLFVFEALRFAQQQLGLDRGADDEESGSTEDERHITGQQLCHAIRQYAVKQYGALAKFVLNHWGIHATRDFGEVVFNLIAIGQMRKTDSDRREDFDNVFEFNEAFRDPFGTLASDTGKGRDA
jgi:uncharacterized repeat protein (TIGR04138 family)